MPLIRGDRIREERERLGLTQNQLAERCKMSGRQLQRLESGESDLTGDTLIRLARVLGTSTDYLAGLSSERTGHAPDLTDAERALFVSLRSGDQSLFDLIVSLVKQFESRNRR